MAHLLDKLNTGPSVGGLQIICFVKLWKFCYKGNVTRVETEFLQVEVSAVKFADRVLAVEISTRATPYVSEYFIN